MWMGPHLKWIHEVLSVAVMAAWGVLWVVLDLFHYVRSSTNQPTTSESPRHEEMLY